MIDKRLILPLTLVAAIVVLALVGLTLYKIPKPECQPGYICIDPKKVSCFVFDMSAERWRPSSVELRGPISMQVYNHKAEYKFLDAGIDCYELDKHFVLGERVAQLPVEWWRPVKGRR